MHGVAVTLSKESGSTLHLFLVGKKNRASAPRSLGCDHREHSVLEKWLQGEKPLENVKYNHQHRPKSGQKENFRKEEAQRTFQHLVFSTWLCKGTQRENEFCAAFWAWCLHFLSLDILSLDILLLLCCNFYNLLQTGSKS